MSVAYPHNYQIETHRLLSHETIFQGQEVFQIKSSLSYKSRVVTL
jgi:hypothetical protein